MFNSTSKIVVSTSQNDQINGVILPRSNKLLSSDELDKKIEKTRSHILYLAKQVPERNTHGGKNFRVHQASVHDQISTACKRLNLLQAAKLAAIQAKPTIPASWPIKDLPIFQYRYHDEKKGMDVYRLDDSKLCNDRCHMFFPVDPCEELLIATALEYMTFHPKNQKMNKKFDIVPVKCAGIELLWCNFPKEFKDTCQNAGNVFGMTMKIMPRVMVAGSLTTQGTAIEFPAKDNILSFYGKRCDDPEQIVKEHENIIWVGNRFERQGVE